MIKYKQQIILDIFTKHSETFLQRRHLPHISSLSEPESPALSILVSHATLEDLSISHWV